MGTAGWIILAIVVVVVIVLIMIYNRLVSLNQRATQSWSDISVQLKQRHDLIPNLVETVKANAKFEKETLDAVTKARASATQVKIDTTDPEAMKKLSEANGALNSALSRLLVASENYPELKANESFKNLQVQLEGTENRILRAREEYNKAAADYNSALMKVRGKAVNKLTGQPFKPREYYKAEAAATGAAPKVSF
jgi:LemA protein